MYNCVKEICLQGKSLRVGRVSERARQLCSVSGVYVQGLVGVSRPLAGDSEGSFAAVMRRLCFASCRTTDSFEIVVRVLFGGVMNYDRWLKSCLLFRA